MSEGQKKRLAKAVRVRDQWHCTKFIVNCLKTEMGKPCKHNNLQDTYLYQQQAK